MDWDYHIVNEEAKGLAKALIPYATEAFLTRFANKGIYKRAVKDLSGLKFCALEAENAALKVQLDEICVILLEALPQSTCSCPSKAVCKHKVMAVLCAAQIAETCMEPALGTALAGISEPAQKMAEPYEALKMLAPEALKKRVGKRAFAQALRWLRKSGNPQFTEKDGLLTVKLGEGVSVYFPAQDSIVCAVCQCKAADFCHHKLAAVLAYWQHNRLFTEKEISGESSAGFKGLFQEADRQMVQLLDKGLAYASETDLQWTEQLSLRFETLGIGNLSRMFRRLSTELSHFMQKNASFQRESCFALLANLHNRLRLLIQYAEDADWTERLLEDSRSSYFPVAEGHFIGLGAYPWRTKSGYCGITSLLWHEEQACVCTYSISRPVFYKDAESTESVSAMKTWLHHGRHWAENTSMGLIASRRFTLRYFKVNQQNRISSSQKTSVVMNAPTRVEDVLLLPFAEQRAERLLHQPPFVYFAKKRPEKAVLVAAAGLEEVFFDQVGQKLTFYFSGLSGIRFRGEIPYAPFMEPAIRFLEQFSKKACTATVYFVCLLRNQALFPVSLIDETGVRQFYFDSQGANL